MKNFSKCVVLLATGFIVCFNSLKAQNSYTLTAKEAVDLAFKYVVALRNANLDYRIQKAQNAEITSQAYPQVNGTVSASHFFSIPVTAIPDFISPGIYQILEDNNVENSATGNTIKSPGNFGIFPAQFGVPWTASAGFTIQQLLFQPDVFVGLQARETSLEYATNNVRLMEDSVRSNVYNSYYAVLIANKQLVFISDAVRRLEKLLHDQNIMYQNGFVEKLEVNRTQVALTNVRTNQNNLQNLSRLGMAALKVSMGIAQKDSLVLSDTLSLDVISEGVLDNSGFRYEDRSEIKVLNSVKRLQELDVKRNRMAYIPTVAAFWNYSRNAQRLKFNFFDTNEKWFPTSIIGLNINVPIFDGFQKKYRIRQAIYSLEKTTNTIENLKNVIDFQQEAARIQLANAISAVRLQQDNMELAQSVYNTSKAKFEQGVGSNFEILQAETELQTAQQNYFQALYNATVARTAYLRAIGKL